MAFHERRTAQLAAYLLKKRGGTMSYMKLIKLLYLIDRESFASRGSPITGDTYFSMKNGPVLSNVLNLVAEDPELGSTSYWSALISGPTAAREVSLVAESCNETLSDEDLRIADMVFNTFGTMSRWEIRDHTHSLPEWHRCSSGRMRINPVDILKAVGRADADEEADELKSVSFVHSVVCSR